MERLKSDSKFSNKSTPETSIGSSAVKRPLQPLKVISNGSLEFNNNLGSQIRNLDFNSSFSIIESNNPLEFSSQYTETEEEAPDEGAMALDFRSFPTASRSLRFGMCLPFQIAPKELSEVSVDCISSESSYTVIHTVSRCAEMSSTLLPKIAILRMDQVSNAFACTGYTSAPVLEYSDLPGLTRSFPANFDLSWVVLDWLSLTSVSWISFGVEHTLAVTSEGLLFQWKQGFPTLVSELMHTSVLYATAGAYHSAAITENGELYTWGRGDVHQLGLPVQKLKTDRTYAYSDQPLRLKYFAKRNIDIRGVACGEAHTLALDSEGKVYAFGLGEDGQLGMGPADLQDNFMSFAITPISALEGTQVIKVAAGGLFSACLDDRGRIFTWGCGCHGELGHRSNESLRYPTEVRGIPGEKVDVVCGETHALCINANGEVFGWGTGVAGAGDFDYSIGCELVCVQPQKIHKLDMVLNKSLR